MRLVFLLMVACDEGAFDAFDLSAPEDWGVVDLPPSQSDLMPAPMAAIPQTTFTVGCDESLECRNAPVRTVTIRVFSIDVREVSKREFHACEAVGLCHSLGDLGGSEEDAMVLIPRDQAAAYCAWVGKRLPTWDEWELAARGSDGRTYPWGEAAPDCTRAWSSECGDRPTTVGGRPAGASPFGVMDLSGNVSEWTENDGVHKYYWRGGSYEEPATSMGADFISGDEDGPFLGMPNVGFRCAR